MERGHDRLEGSGKQCRQKIGCGTQKEKKKNASIIDSSATISTSEFFETSDDSSSQSIEEKSDKGNKSDNIFDDI
jgi:hypothetical protein